MLKRPLLCGVLAFVIGQIIISRGNMTWGLGMIPIGFVIWCIRKRNQSGIMPFLLWLYLICLLLGGLNGMRCRMLSPLQKYMDACYEENGQEEVLCEMEGRVERAEIQKGKWIFLIRANRIRNERFQYQSPCRVKLYSKEGDIKIGDRITCELTLKRLPIPTNPGEFNSRQYYLARGIEFIGYADTVRVLDEGRYMGKQWLWKLRMQTQKVFQMHMSEEYASVMNAMLLGDSGNLDPEIKQLYQRNGIAHILAISGLHVSILGSMLYRLLRKLGLPYGAAGPPVIGLLLAYGWLTGQSGSASRAITMLILAMVGDMIGRTYDMLTAIGIAAVLQLVEYPYRLFDAGFLLSFGAVLTLGLVIPAWKELIKESCPVVICRSVEREKTTEKKLIGKLWAKGKQRIVEIIRKVPDTLITGIIIQMITGPIVIFFYYEYPVYGILLNFHVIPMMTPLILLGLGCLFLTPWFYGGAGILAIGCEWILRSFSYLCLRVQELPGAVWHVGNITVWMAAGYYGMLAGIYVLLKYKKKHPAGMLAMVLTGMLLIGKADRFRITMLDVGQGDSALIETPEHQLLLIDGGSTSRSSVGKYVIEPAMKYYGYGKLDYIFISHMDSDHVNGVYELIGMMETGEVEIGCLVLPEAGRDCVDSGYPELAETAEAAGISVIYLQAGAGMKSGTVTIRCLYPGQEFLYPDANNNSMVLELSTEEFRMLFTGDLEQEGEQSLESEAQMEQYDVLKVGHHGSSGASSKEFIQKICPQYALISCGRNNSYGHPHEETLERFREADIGIFRTDEQGAIMLEPDGKRRKITYFKKQEAGE